MKKKLVKACMILLSVLLLLAGSMYGIYFYLFHYSKYYDLIKYEEKLLDIEMKERIEEADGYIIFDGETEYAEVRLQVKRGCEKELSDELDESLGMRLSSVSEPFAYPSHELEYEINEKAPEYYYELLMPGTHGLMTRDVRVFIVNDEDRDMYIYIFG